MDPLDLSPTVLALVAAQAVSPADASSTVITKYSLDRELDILRGTMLIPKTNLPADWRAANPTKGYTDWIAEQLAEKTSWFELKQVQDDTVRRYRRVIQPGDPDQTQYPNYEDLMVAVNNKVNMGDTLTRSELSDWLTNYINANPNTWVNLRTLLQYYPITFVFFNFPPTREWLPRAEYMVPHSTPPVAGAVWQWNNTTNDRPVTTQNTIEYGLLSPPTTGVPAGFSKQNGHRWSILNQYWQNKGTFFLVYSWTNTVGNTLINCSHGTPLPRLLLTRNNLEIIAESTNTYVSPSKSDTGLDTPYIMGISWDFTITPPRVLWMNHNRAVEHIGPNEPTEILELDNPLGLVGTPTTSMNLPYSATLAAASRTGANSLTFFGTKANSTTGGPACKIHYFAQWDNLLMTMDQARTVHIRLLQRYCTPPFDVPIRGLSE